MGDLDRSHGKEPVRYYHVDLAQEKFPHFPRNLDDWKDLVSQEGKERIEAVIKEEIFKNLGS